MDLQVGAASKWKVDKTGLVTQTGSLVISSGVLTVPDGSAGAPSIALASNAFEGFFHNNGSFQFGVRQRRAIPLRRAIYSPCARP